MSTPKSHQVRHDLLDAARALIAERGWTAVSTRTLAQRAGVGPGLVHYHFASLNALLNEAALTGMDQVIDQTLTHLSRTDPRQGLDQLLGKLDAYPPTTPPPSCSPRPTWPPHATPTCAKASPNSSNACAPT